MGNMTPFRMWLPIAEKIRLAVPKMQKIWANSAAARAGRDEPINTVMKTEKSAREQLAAGVVGLDDRMTSM